MASDWIVFHSRSESPIVTNELGYGYFQEEPNGPIGYVVPLTKEAVLGVIPRWSNTIAIGRWPGTWSTPIVHKEIHPTTHKMLNSAIAHAAQDCIFGPNEAAVRSLEKEMSNRSADLPPLVWKNFPRPTLVAHELDWHRFVTAISIRPGDLPTSLRDIDWKEVTEGGWHSAVFLGVSGNPPQAIGIRSSPTLISIKLQLHPTMEQFTESVKYALGTGLPVPREAVI